MRTVASETCSSPAICFAIDSSRDYETLAPQFARLGYKCSQFGDLQSFESFLDSETPALIILSFDLFGRDSLEYCRRHSSLLEETPVAFVARQPVQYFQQALEAIRMGAIDVLIPPFDSESLAALASKAMGSEQPSSRPNGTNLPRVSSPSIGQGTNPRYTNGDSLNSAVSKHSVLASPAYRSTATTQDARLRDLESWILGSSPAIREVRSIIAEVADTNANVMIYGASGTGKELVATALHRLSSRCNGPFEPLNMTEIPHELAESLLFGHEKGSFTSADSRQIGICEVADGGTLFLDEIGELDLAIQPKLLRFLQEGTVKPVGSHKTKHVDVRVITATNRDPNTIVKSGLMREDLFFRLHVVPIHIPPLCERTEDIEQLATVFLRRYVKAYNRSVERFSPEAIDIFCRHDWPGNVRQLENVVERLVVFAKGRFIEAQDIPAEIHAASIFDDTPNSSYHSRHSHAFGPSPDHFASGEDAEVAQAVAAMSPIQRTERTAIIEALQRSNGHVIDAANLLGLGQATVYRKIKQYHIPHQRRRRRRTPK